MECNVKKQALLLLCGLAWVGCAWGIERRSKWGSDLSREECYASGGDKRYDAIMAGEIAPYAFTGPPDECTSEGCMHDYWGAKCRWRDPRFPSCPKETREGLIKLLKDYSRNGAWWAREALTQQPCELWETIRGRTLWFAGDSLTQETAQSFICFLLEYFESAKVADPVSKNPKVMHRLKFNANNNKMTTWCVLFKEYTRICMLRANFGPRMGGVLLPALVDLTAAHDIVVINFGLWSNHLPELAMHVEVFAASFKFHRPRMPNRTYWRETSAQHYSTASGMFDKEKPTGEQSCRPPFPGVNLTISVDGSIIPQPGSRLPPPGSPEAWETAVVMQGGYRNKATQPTVDALGLHTIRAWNTSLALWNFHHHTHLPNEPQACSNGECDCTHACHPSWPQLWLPKFRDAFGNSENFMKGGKPDWFPP